jgi:5-methyltetrahydrofolate corrinoid/iron sulfur protein methyltransferase
MMLEDIAPGAKSTCGLSNISNGPPVHLRPILNTTYMVMLERYGMKAVISDPLDTNLTAVAKGKRPDIVEVVHQTMDGNAPALSGLSKELGDYVKTVKVILGETLFSDSYLDI